MTEYDSNDYEDIELICIDDGRPFTWSALDQAYYAERGYNDPKRCPACRAARRAAFEQARREPHEEHKITCDECGAQAIIPFKPDLTRPVYCTVCYRKRQRDSRAG